MQKIISINRLNNSKNGNPKFRIVFEDNGEKVVGVTSNDAGFAYAITGYEKGLCGIQYKKRKDSSVAIITDFN